MRWVVKIFMFLFGVGMLACAAINVFITHEFLLSILCLVTAGFDFYQAFTF